MVFLWFSYGLPMVKLPEGSYYPQIWSLFMAVDPAPGGFPTVVWLRMAVRFYQAFWNKTLAKVMVPFTGLIQEMEDLHGLYMDLYDFAFNCLQFTAIAMVKNLWSDDDQPVFFWQTLDVFRQRICSRLAEAMWIFQHYQRVTHFYQH